MSEIFACMSADVSVAHLKESENGLDFKNLLMILYFGFPEYVKRLVLISL